VSAGEPMFAAVERAAHRKTDGSPFRIGEAGVSRTRPSPSAVWRLRSRERAAVRGSSGPNRIRRPDHGVVAEQKDAQRSSLPSTASG
jgi:hypothetical protein